MFFLFFLKKTKTDELTKAIRTEKEFRGERDIYSGSNTTPNALAIKSSPSNSSLYPAPAPMLPSSWALFLRCEVIAESCVAVPTAVTASPPSSATEANGVGPVAAEDACHAHFSGQNSWFTPVLGGGIARTAIIDASWEATGHSFSKLGEIRRVRARIIRATTTNDASNDRRRSLSKCVSQAPLSIITWTPPSLPLYGISLLPTTTKPQNPGRLLLTPSSLHMQKCCFAFRRWPFPNCALGHLLTAGHMTSAQVHKITLAARTRPCSFAGCPPLLFSLVRAKKTKQAVWGEE